MVNLLEALDLMTAGAVVAAVVAAVRGRRATVRTIALVSALLAGVCVVMYAYLSQP